MRTVREWMKAKRPRGYSTRNAFIINEYKECLDTMGRVSGFRASEKYRIMRVMEDLDEYMVEHQWYQAFMDDIESLKERCRYLTIIENKM